MQGLKGGWFSKFLFVVTTVFLILAVAATPAMAASNVAYVDATGNSYAITSATDITSSTTTWSNGWYVASGSVTIPSRVTVSGTVNLILADDADLNVNGGIAVNSGNTLIIWAQSEGTGKLTADASGAYRIQNGVGDNAGIGGNYANDAGTITINGGVITAIGDNRAAGIGGGGDSSYSNVPGGKAGTITINGGKVTAKGGSSGAGIGSCADVKGGSIKITGGVVQASTLGGVSAGHGMASITVTGCPVITCAGYINGKSSGTSYEATWTSGILYASTAEYALGIVFGSPTLTQDVIIPNGKTLNIPSGSTLIIPNGKKLVVGDWGYLKNIGTINIEEGGVLSTWMLDNQGTIKNDGILEGRSTSSSNSYRFENDGTINGDGIIKSKQPITGSGTIPDLVKTDLTHLTLSGTYDTVNGYTATLTAHTEYLVPELITVTMGGSLLPSSSYTYTKDSESSSTLTIAANNIKGNILITAVGVPKSYGLELNHTTIEFDLTYGYSSSDVREQTIKINNTGNTEVTIDLPTLGTNSNVTITAGSGFNNDGKATLDINAEATFSIKPNTGLDVSLTPYREEIIIKNSSDPNINATLEIIITVSPKQLDAPATVAWDNTGKATWAAVQDNEGYFLELLKFNGSAYVSVDEEIAGNDTTSHIFAITEPGSYNFTVRTMGDTVRTLYSSPKASSNIVHTVSFEPNGGSFVPMQFVITNSVATNPTLTKDGSSLQGWYSDKDFTTEWDFATQVTEPTVLYALWDNYTITTIAGTGGSVTGDGTFARNTDITVTASPSAGYSFVRWTEDDKEVSTNPSYTFKLTEDRILVAVFEEIPDYGSDDTSKGTSIWLTETPTPTETPTEHETVPTEIPVTQPTTEVESPISVLSILAGLGVVAVIRRR